ncbi:unnamed protein product [Calypogeia fissa]
MHHVRASGQNRLVRVSKSSVYKNRSPTGAACVRPASSARPGPGGLDGQLAAVGSEECAFQLSGNSDDTVRVLDCSEGGPYSLSGNSDNTVRALGSPGVGGGENGGDRAAGRPVGVTKMVQVSGARPRPRPRPAVRTRPSFCTGARMFGGRHR